MDFLSHFKVFKGKGMDSLFLKKLKIMQEADSINESNQPWQISLMVIRLASTLLSLCELAHIKANKGVATDSQSIHDRMISMFNDNNHPSPLSELRDIASSVSNLSTAKVTHDKINRIESFLKELLLKYQRRLDIKFMGNPTISNKPNHSTQSCHGTKCIRERFENLFNGYFRQIPKDEFNLEIPDSLRLVCLEYFGMIWMNSNILNMAQINCIGVLLQNGFDNEINNFYVEKVFEAAIDGYDAESFDEKCNKFENVLTVIHTNYGHKIATFSRTSYESNLNKDNSKKWSVMLESSYHTVIHSHGVQKFIGDSSGFIDANEEMYHVPNGLDISMDMFDDNKFKTDLTDFEFLEIAHVEIDETACFHVHRVSTSI